MADDNSMDRPTGSECIEDSAIPVHELEPWNGTSADDGADNFCAASPTFEDLQRNFWHSPSAGQDENLEQGLVNAVAEDGYEQVTNDSVILPSSTLTAGGGSGTQSWNNLPHSDDSSNCSSPRDDETNSEENFGEALAEDEYREVENDRMSLPSSTMPSEGSGTGIQPSNDLSGDSSSSSTPTDDTQMPFGLLEIPFKQMMSCIRSLPQTDENTLIKQYRGVYCNRKVIIKQFPEAHKRTFLKLREMAYLRHTYILPVIGYTMRNQMVMYPEMVRGDLTKACDQLGWVERCRILYQLSAVISFLHSAIPGVREEIWHGRIKAENIYLDQNLNVRLGDFSVAIELRKKSARPGDIRNDDVGGKKCLKDDIYNFGSVALFLLNSLGGTIYCPFRNVKQIMWDMKIWKPARHWTHKELANLIVLCSRKCITAECLESNFESLLRSHHIPFYNTFGNHRNDCIHCCVNTIDDNPVPALTSEFCPDACSSRRFCHTCCQTSYRNILFCPEHGPLKDKIHQKDVFAILVSGSGKTDEEQYIFDGDVDSMFNAITDPKILGISSTNVFRIGRNSVDKRQDIYRNLKKLKTEMVHTLLFFYSGHGTKVRSDEDDGDNDIDDIPRFQLGNSSDTSMTYEDLRKLLTRFTMTNLFVIMDCCYAERYKTLPPYKNRHPKIWHVLFNGTGSSHFGWMDSKINSVFTSCLVRALEGGWSCPEGLCDSSTCDARIKLQGSSTRTGYISLKSCREYIAAHLKDYSVDSNLDLGVDSNLVTSGIPDDLPIARYTGSPSFIFKHDIGGNRRRLVMYHLQDDPSDMLRQLWDAIGKECQLPKNLNFRCLMLTVPGNKREREIKTKFEVMRECRRGHAVQIRIRSRYQDLHIDRCVVCFFPDNTHFIDVLDLVEETYKDFFLYEFPPPPDDIEVLRVAVFDIRMDNVPDLSTLQSTDKHIYEQKKFTDLIGWCLTCAYKIARGNMNICGLRINITSNLAMLELERKTTFH